MEVPGIKSPWINWVINLMAGLLVRVERRHGGKPGEVETATHTRELEPAQKLEEEREDFPQSLRRKGRTLILDRERTHSCSFKPPPSVVICYSSSPRAGTQKARRGWWGNVKKHLLQTEVSCMNTNINSQPRSKCS